jgi:AcrR family transcriptional regulator
MTSSVHRKPSPPPAAKPAPPRRAKPASAPTKAVARAQSTTDSSRGRSPASGVSGKGEATRARILEAALGLFRKRGFEETTMREVASAAGMSLGAAYHYFPSKEAIVFAFYERTQEEHDARVRDALAEGPRDLRARLGAVVHGKLEQARRDRPLLGALLPWAARPGGPLSVFAPETRSIRERAIGLFEEALGDAVPVEARRMLASALWLGLLGALLYFIHDRSPRQERTRRLVDGALDLMAPLVPFIASPAAAPLRQRVGRLVADAGLAG